MRTIDLSTDAESRPTSGMLQALVRAEVGNEQRGTDPTVRKLEARVADLLGHEAGVFLPSGTMCNAIAIRLHIRPGGDEIILDCSAHPGEFEAGGPAALSGASLRRIDTRTGIFGAAEVRAAVREDNRYAPRSRLLIVEQATWRGTVWPAGDLQDVVSEGRSHGLLVHLDGARLLNAAVAASVPAATFASIADTAFVDFAKGLGCPAGAVLAGSRDAIDEAWRYKQMWGGAMRQTGYLAAACLYALDENVLRLGEDHANARVLAEAISTMSRAEVDPATIETNIVVFRVDDAKLVAAELRAAGVDVLTVDDRQLRAVTYPGIDRELVDEAIARMRPVLDA